MGKMLVEICLISARGLRVGIGIGSSLLKHQWYAVGWLDPEDKYCTTIDASRSDNPVWRTKFATLLDDSAVQDSKSVLRVEVYSREPLFLRKRLHGSATVSLKEFLTKYKQQPSSSSKAVVEETGSYQLRKQNSSKPQGFVDVSIRISAEQADFGVFTGDFGGVMLSNNTSGQDYMAGPSQHPFAPMNQSNNSNPFSVPPYNHNSSVPYPPMNHTNPQMQQPYYPPPMQPPPPMNSGYMPAAYISKSENVTNIPSSSSSSGGAPGGAGRGYARPGPGFAAGLGAGAVVGAAAGLYGGEFMSGFDLPSTLPHPSVSISIDPPF
ncbi:PREDICTED: U1 small nuclear ribonucleoprotein C-like [Camelina sativa]|uniref:U1 small nuclear ribonucleoprotein C-like n=1 Tax=Camelina sativa TaxID=90675 RepID=A0ABM0YTZ2_CAMSA|nr:PREDICTED: U1 small nuclear ribonucleoprotein C-like [Camelina sativa]